MSLPRFNATIFTLAALVILPSLASAQGIPYQPNDTPDLSSVDAGLYSMTLRVQAGDSGAPGGFAIQWMKLADYQAAGGWPSNAADPRIGSAYFVGSPTLNLWGATTFQLGPGEIAYVQPGDLFDETGVAAGQSSREALQPGADYVTRVCALPGGGGTTSPFTGALGTRTLNGECTQGFWKNHPDLWPATCLPMLLGTVSYTNAQLIQLFGQPAQGNGLISLAHQLITAKLDLCNGSDPTAAIGAIASADALIGPLVPPPIGAGYLDPSTTSSLTETLDDYNNGRLGGVAECPTMTRTESTWGALKVLYR